MLAGILTALKIIGIVLLCLIAFILFLILLILFVPVRYRLDGTVPETEFESAFDVNEIVARARFSWLLHIISGGIEFPEHKEFTIRVFGIKVFPLKKKSKEEKSDSEDKTDSDDKESLSDTDIHSEKKANSESGNVQEEKTEDKVEDKTDPESENDQINDKNDSVLDNDNTTDQKETDENESTEEKDKALIEIITDIFEKIENILKTPQNVLEKIQYTISRVYGKMSMLKTTLENDIFKRAFELVKGKLIRLIKMIMPDKSKIDLRLGTGDPADTAEFMAVYGMLYPVLFRNVSFEPDFDRKVLYADAHFKGHITLFTVLYCVCVCYFNKDVKKVIKRFKKIMKA